MVDCGPYDARGLDCGGAVSVDSTDWECCAPLPNGESCNQPLVYMGVGHPGPCRYERRVRLLRGQVVVRELRPRQIGYVVVPDCFYDAEAQKATAHRGEVLAMGAPALTLTGAEVEPGFSVGDIVYFHWIHNEKAWTREWTDGKPACWVPQEAVDAVEEPERIEEPDPCSECCHFGDPD